MIHFENVHIGYRESIVNVQVHTLQKGTAYALIGKNGSGKSTFLKSVSGQLAPYSGTITVAGDQLSALHQQQLAELISFVPSRIPETSYMTVFDFVALGRTPYLNALGRLKDSDKEMITGSIQQLGLTSYSKRFLNELSDGEKQLCAIARAVCQDTPVILLDEPTSFLDFRNRSMVIDLLQHIAATSQKCILFSTHEIHLLAEKKMPILGINGSGILAFAEEVTIEALVRHFFNGDNLETVTNR